MVRMRAISIWRERGRQGEREKVARARLDRKATYPRKWAFVHICQTTSLLRHVLPYVDTMLYGLCHRCLKNIGVPGKQQVDIEE